MSTQSVEQPDRAEILRGLRATHGGEVVFSAGVAAKVLGGVIVLPYTRYSRDNTAWSSQADSTIGSADGDIIETHIEPISDPTVVVFTLNNWVPSGWDKAMILRDGLGGEWWIEAKGHSRAENGLYADQLGNGQHITFWKPKTFGRWTEMFSINGLEHLQAGSRVTFTWVDDDGP